MTDYYALLDVDPGAGKDEIRAAYRAQRDRLEAELEDGRSAARRDEAARRLGELHRAWAVLSDPVQRDRYDAARARGETPDEDAGSSPAPAPARPARTARPAPEPTVHLPAGMHLAEGRARAMAALFDLSVLALIYLLGVSLVLPAVLRSTHPAEMERLDEISETVPSLEDRRDARRDRAEQAAQRAARARRAGREADAAAARAEARAARADAGRIDRRIEALQQEARELQGRFLVVSYLVALGIVLACLAYLVPPTALGGQTLGKRLRRVWVVDRDGHRAGWRRATIRYLLPVGLAVLVPQLGLVVALGVVAWALRDRNRQGLHDRVAGTLVVDRPPLDR
jgi:hypothetical protein